ncbi:MAG TPA: hypothetical protein VK168_13160 [Saprospiraceae bacterium]|nr:hypothetical protein [Saprospiraceae bacterium]
MKKLGYVVGSLVVVILLGFCVQPPDYPDEPQIKYIGLSKNIMNQGEGYTDSLFVTFSFTDGDGDLGYPESDPTGSVFIRDSRDSFFKPPLQLPYVEPLGAANGISGEITVKLPTTCCIYTSPEGFKFPCDEVPVTFQFDSFSYFIKIRDRAGHESNEIKTDVIRLRCQ